MPITKNQKVYKCELCNYSTTYKHLITNHINRTKKCNIDNENVSITFIPKDTPTTSGIEDEDNVRIIRDQEDIKRNILDKFDYLDYEEIAYIIKIYMEDNLDEEHKTEFLEILNS